MSCIIIAEVGENHLGDMDIAKKLIKDAAEAGADYVKFQSYKPENFRKDDPEYKWFKKVALSDDDHFVLRDCAKKHKIKFLSSPICLERARFLCETLGLQEIKIASGVMLNSGLLQYVNIHAKKVFLSTGMATLDDIDYALTYLKSIKDIFILHCVTQYPCKDEEANLRAITTLKQKFPKHTIGYSDHAVGTEACLAAVALGAQVIEKHFTFDKKAKEGTDHILSVTADELKEMIKHIRRIEAQLGSPEKEPTESERSIINFVRGRFIK